MNKEFTTCYVAWVLFVSLFTISAVILTLKGYYQASTGMFMIAVLLLFGSCEKFSEVADD